MMNPSVSSIEEDSAVDHGYDVEVPGGKSSTASIHVSGCLPKHIRQSAMKLDLDCDGAFGQHDNAHAVNHLDNIEQKNKYLHRIVAAFGIFSLLLIGYIFGATTTAARLSKDVNFDPINGFAYVKGSTTEVMKTTDNAVIYSNSMGVAEMPNGNLIALKEVILAEGDVRFAVKGHARDILTGDVLILVEGGTLTFDNSNGIVDATGDARILLKATFGSDAFLFDGGEYEDHTTSEGQRHLYTGCGGELSTNIVHSICPFTGRFEYKCVEWEAEITAEEEIAVAEEKEAAAEEKQAVAEEKEAAAEEKEAATEEKEAVAEEKEAATEEENP